MLASPQITTVKSPNKKPGISGQQVVFLHQHIVKLQFVWQKLCYNIPLAGLLQKHIGLGHSSTKHQKSFVCLHKMCLTVVLWKRMFYKNDDLSTTCQCWQLKLNPLSMQINIYCLMTNQIPALLVQCALWMRAAMMFLQSLYFFCPPPSSAIIPDAHTPGTFENQDGRH